MNLKIELSERGMWVLETIMHNLGIETKKELFNTALALLKWAGEERAKGNVIASLNEDTGAYTELVIPALETLNSTPVQKKVSQLVRGGG